MQKDNERGKELPEINADYIDKLLSYQPAPQEPVAPTQEPDTKAPSAGDKHGKPKKALILITAAAVLFVICLLVFLPAPDSGPTPDPGISDEQWLAICRDAYNQLYQAEQLHFSHITTSYTPAGKTVQTEEIWFSGADYYRKLTMKDGYRRASCLKDGIHYANRQKELFDVGWRISENEPAFVRGSGTWEEGKYTLDHIDRTGEQIEVVFFREVDSPSTQTRIHYLTFRFDPSRKLTAIVFENVLFSNTDVDPEQISRSICDEYIFHDETLQQIVDAINIPLQRMENYRQEKAEWDSICGAVFDDLCSRTVLHYTVETLHTFVVHFTNTEEGWICGTDSAKYVTSQGENNSQEEFRVNIGNEGYKKRNLNGEEGSWERFERTPSMHIYFQQTWNPNYYTFHHAQSSDTGTNVTFFYSPTTFDSGYITFCLDLNNQLQSIQYQNDDASRITEYRIYYVTEAEARAEIDKYYQLAADNS